MAVKAATVKVRVISNNIINFGSAKEPDHKGYGETVECGKKKAQNLAALGLIEIMKEEEKQDGN